MCEHNRTQDWSNSKLSSVIQESDRYFRSIPIFYAVLRNKHAIIRLWWKI